MSDESDWIRHDGGAFPGPDPTVLVYVKLRDGSETDAPHQAAAFEWPWQVRALERYRRGEISFWKYAA